ncbi:Transcription factor HES-3 [Bagarius yarrelli]|uniref:Transcription factor HES-3 n=1 Tax=Bagarius yarrelli TaxID=175774 RepID=A0A556U218_BAGYA|nr:Transcription factor HES-3 [Bagarius yarrelli]
MVAASETPIKTKVSAGKKISKPLMEKKRRARINTCLDQLKILLEGCYSNNIRKRKFEKADILELTVKHLKHLQNTEKVFAVNSAISEYQAGFRTCISGVQQYLLMSDANPALRSNALAHLSNALLCLSARLPDSSTLDSDAVLHTRAPTSPRTDVTRHLNDVKASPNVQQKWIKISNKDKTTLTPIGVNQTCSSSTNLQQNYWRPW